jgi:hypothetical protein
MYTLFTLDGQIAEFEKMFPLASNGGVDGEDLPLST